MMKSPIIKIIALPFAGGNVYSYRSFELKTPLNYEWITIELPGRGKRLNQDFINEFSQQVLDVYNQVVNSIENTDYIIYGHSMGGLLGYELAKMLIKNKKRLPLFLYFTGRNSPSVEFEKKISNLPMDEFWNEIFLMGGISDEIMKNEDLKLFFEPILRSDFRSIENYKYLEDVDKMSLPIFLRIGDQEKIKMIQLKDWQNETTIPINIRVLNGNHFFIFNNYQLILDEMVSLTTDKTVLKHVLSPK
ncbi:Thioesterase [Flavobacterium sp. 9AF]|uniref:thioesterase II family protein n=1 Tax=Flavobacterium sp. 9AF TaxID=2653142 RepID=UPI0012F3699E|nr:thioesterase domain-containing protein [Flavobacterium sp. 9AF]VXC06031.1 Thioesterase [Flavobacterium sp. 9AF]